MKPLGNPVKTAHAYSLSRLNFANPIKTKDEVKRWLRLTDFQTFNLYSIPHPISQSVFLAFDSRGINCIIKESKTSQTDEVDSHRGVVVIAFCLSIDFSIYQTHSSELKNWKSDNMSTAARKRLMRDFKRLQHDPPTGVQGSPLDNNVMIWQAVIFG